MKIELFCFSGTGNSLKIAKMISRETMANIISIGKVINQKNIILNSNLIIIVFPVYYGNLPNIIKLFAEKLTNIESKSFILVSNFGGGAGVSLKYLSKIIKSKGGVINGKYQIQMPQNSFYKFWVNDNKIIEKSKNKIRKISKNFNKKVLISSNLLFDLIQLPLQILFDYLVKKHLIKITQEDKKKSLTDLIYLADKSFIIKNNCNSCGICSKVCPVKNIKIVNNFPIWLHHCENCLACYNFCPKKAIKTGLIEKDYYYINPEINVLEYIKFNSSTGSASV